MRIGIETEGLTPPLTGVDYLTRTLIEALKKKRVAIQCFHSRGGKHIPLAGVAHHYFRKPLPFPFSHSLAALTHSGCFEKLDVMHFPLPKVLYGRRPRVPIVLTVHDICPLIHPQYFSAKTRCMMGKVLPRYLRDADAVITVSHATQRDLVAYFPFVAEKVRTIHCALPPPSTQVNREKKSYLLYIGSFEKRKNIQGILDAFAQLRLWGFAQTLVLVGRGKCPSPLPDHVLFKGYVSEKEKEVLIQEAAVLVWPSFYEGFGLPLLEAMRLGTPIVTSNISSMPEVVGEAALLVDPHVPKAIAQGIAEIVSTPALEKDLIQKGLERAKYFSLEKMGKETYEVYESLCS